MILAPTGSGLFAALGGNDGAADGPLVDLQLAWRTDLNGAAAEPYWPCFFQLTGTVVPAGLGVSVVLTVSGPNADRAEVRTFPPDAASVPWTPDEDADGISGALRGADGSETTWAPSDRADDGTVSSLIMASFAEPGDYELTVTPLDAATGRRVGAPAGAVITVSDGRPPLFGQPVLGQWGGEGWRDATSVGTSLGFSLSAPTTELWRASQPWSSYYNWTVTAVCPTGMAVGGDLSVYNTGDLRVDRGALNATSVVSAWENGYNTVFYTVWDRDGGTRLSGQAAMTPTGKELTYASGAYHSWVTGTWTPFGAGSVTFRDAGHYLLVIALTDGEGPVGPPIVLETVVS